MKRIQLSGHKKGTRVFGYALVDDEDFERINKYKWSFSGQYAGRSKKINGKWRIIYMQKFIINTPKGYVIDHINHNKLDNRKENLRICTQQQNTWNSIVRSNNKSKEKGIFFFKSGF